MEWFKNRIDAKILIEDFRREYNEVRPHSSLGQLTPAEFKQKLSQQQPGRWPSPKKWSEESRQVIATIKFCLAQLTSVRFERRVLADSVHDSNGS